MDLKRSSVNATLRASVPSKLRKSFEHLHLISGSKGDHAYLEGPASSPRLVRVGSHAQRARPKSDLHADFFVDPRSAREDLAFRRDEYLRQTARQGGRGGGGTTSPFQRRTQSTYRPKSAVESDSRRSQLASKVPRVHVTAEEDVVSDTPFPCDVEAPWGLGGRRRSGTFSSLSDLARLRREAEHEPLVKALSSQERKRSAGPLRPSSLSHAQMRALRRSEDRPKSDDWGGKVIK